MTQTTDPQRTTDPRLSMAGLALDEARELITGPRAEAYGDSLEAFTRIGRMWGALLGIEVSPAQVAMCLAGLKLSRLAYEPDRFDSWADLIGYGALGAGISLVHPRGNE